MRYWELEAELSDTPDQPGSPAVLPAVFSQLPGSCLIGVSHFPDSGLEVLRSSFPGSPWALLILSLGGDVSGSAKAGASVMRAGHRAPSQVFTHGRDFTVCP